jgi:PAS domain S-box-containing protein
MSINTKKGKRAEEALKKKTHDLRERVKELNCLYGTTRLIVEPECTLEEVFQGTVDLIHQSWQYPEITCARIIFEGKEFKTLNWKESEWKQSTDFTTEKGKRGVIEVAYLEQKPEIVEGPFLGEERQLIDGLARILEDFIERKSAENALRESEALFRSIYEESPIGIELYDSDGVLIEVNNACLAIFGVTDVSEIKGFKLFEDPNVSETVKERLARGEGIRYETAFDFGLIKKHKLYRTTKSGIVYLDITITPLVREDGSIKGYLVQVHDVSDRKRMEAELKRHLMKYALEEGNLYLIPEAVPNLCIEAFNDLLKVSYQGLVISRTPKEKLKKTFDVGVKFLWLSESGGDNAVPPNFEKIQAKMEDLSRGWAVMIDRLDYLIFKNGFERTLSFVHHLRDFAYLSNSIILMAIDPSILATRELRLLEKEALEVNLKYKIKLPEDLLETLKLVYKKNGRGVKPSRTNMCEELGISYPTVRKRITQLVSSGYLIDIASGNRRVLEITEKGRSLFLR